MQLTKFVDKTQEICCASYLDKEVKSYEHLNIKMMTIIQMELIIEQIVNYK